LFILKSSIDEVDVMGYDWNDFMPFFKKYEELQKRADRIFEEVKKRYPKEVRCKIGCTDCCYALFDLTLVEAMYINYQFFKNITDKKRQEEILEEANRIDRRVYKIKRKLFKEREKGVPTEKILEEASKIKMKCPLLDEEGRCILYEHRPVICRLYGLPLSFDGKVRTCSLSGFVPGKKYPVVFVDKLQDRLLMLSKELVESIPTRYTKLWEVLVPLSMALLTEYNEEYLGIVNETPGVVEFEIGGIDDE